jgi:hypothetical protein
MTARPVLLATLRGVARAPAGAVAGVLLDIGPDGRSPLMPPGQVSRIDTHDGGAYTVTVDQPGSRVTVTVDPAVRTVSTQGQWWYRAEVTLARHDDGCLITQRIFNVARRLRWGVRFVARQPLADSPRAFAAVLDAVHERLDCPAYPLT